MGGITMLQPEDHVIIDRRHASAILKIDSCRGADCDSDHYLVRYEAELEKKLETKQVNWKRESVEGKWNIIKNVLQETADEVFGVKDREKGQGWFDEECREIIKKRNEARRKVIERRTRTNVEQFRQKRKEADKLCGRKKRVWEEEWYTELEEQHNTQEVLH
ncbi:hypothetical protein J437_LFUL008312 [Ladona fulva]|uniref:Uncharacterized protein n=1 Tax=Ladona fulva TaxID=123851 RepID=A0A8K0P0D7_LADFU|nr:hypothetical protein J437_LFUL008312 [Ladona fulva]